MGAATVESLAKDEEKKPSVPVGAGEASPVDWGLDTKPSEKESCMVPWGRHIPRKPGIDYYVVTGYQECLTCRYLIDEAYYLGVSSPFLNAYHERTNNLNHDMITAQQKVLQSCPEFVNDWCYQDLGGTQVLRSPCPDFLKCHYCLGLNPLHCMDGIKQNAE